MQDGCRKKSGCQEKILDMIFAEMQEIRHFQRLEVWICDNAVTNSEENSFEAKESKGFSLQTTPECKHFEGAKGVISEKQTAQYLP